MELLVNIGTFLGAFIGMAVVAVVIFAALSRVAKLRGHDEKNLPLKYYMAAIGLYFSILFAAVAVTSLG